MFLFGFSVISIWFSLNCFFEMFYLFLLVVFLLNVICLCVSIL